MPPQVKHMHRQCPKALHILLVTSLGKQHVKVAVKVATPKRFHKAQGVIKVFRACA